MLMDKVRTPDGVGTVCGYDDEHYVVVMLDDEYAPDAHGVWHKIKGVYRPDEVTLICEK